MSSFPPSIKIKCSEPGCVCYLVSTDEGETIETARVYLSKSGWVVADGKDYCPTHERTE